MTVAGRKLRALLLKLGGKKVLGLESDPPKPNFDFPSYAIEPLLRLGQRRKGKVRLRKRGMTPCHCFENAEQLVKDGREPIYAMGFALTKDDGYWRPHGWCVSKRGTVVETTIVRQAYFGLEFPAEVFNKKKAA